MQGSGSFRLIVRRGPQPNQIYELNKDVITLGRDITNDIVINDPEVSRHHCRLTRGGGGYTLEDLGSTNGSFVNGQRLMGARPLSAGDQVSLGETVLLSYEASVTLMPPDLSQRPVAGPSVPPASYPPAQPQSYPPAAQPLVPAQQAPSAQPQQQPYTPQIPTAQYSQYQPQQPQQQQPQQYNYDASQPIPTGGGASRWFFIGCGCVIVLCIVLVVIAAFYIDANNLYCQVPILRDIVNILVSSTRCR